MHPAIPPATGCATDPVAVAVVDDAWKLQASHPAAPTLDILNLVLQGQRARPIHFGDVSPVNPFGLLLVEAFDQILRIGSRSILISSRDWAVPLTHCGVVFAVEEFGPASWMGSRPLRALF